MALLLPECGDVDAGTKSAIGFEGKRKASHGATALHFACAHGQHATVAALLKHGASRGIVSSELLTPLRFAAEGGHVACCILLVGWPGDFKLSPSEVDAADKKGWTPLHAAACVGSHQLCALLVAAAASLEAQEEHGRTPRELAAERHPLYAALLELLAGGGGERPPGERPPGLACDKCGEPASIFCPGCGGALFCSAECMEGAKSEPQGACFARRALVAQKTKVRFVKEDM